LVFTGHVSSEVTHKPLEVTYTNSDLPSERTVNYAQKRAKTAFVFCAAVLRSLVKNVDSGSHVFQT